MKYSGPCKYYELKKYSSQMNLALLNETTPLRRGGFYTVRYEKEHRFKVINGLSSVAKPTIAPAGNPSSMPNPPAWAPHSQLTGMGTEFPSARHRLEKRQMTKQKIDPRGARLDLLVCTKRNLGQKSEGNLSVSSHCFHFLPSISQ